MNRICYKPEDLPPIPPSINEVFADVETRRRGEDITQGGNDPYLGDTSAMWIVAWDDSPVYCLPIRMRDGNNLEISVALKWLREVFSKAKKWVNHNIKFDAHFLSRSDEIEFEGEMVDTLTMARVQDGFARMSYGLKPLTTAIFGLDVDTQDAVKTFLDNYKLPRNRKARDYALVPTEILGTYGIDDVVKNRMLYRYLQEHMPEGVRPTWDMERKLTPVLWDIEKAGLRTDEQQLQIEKMKTLHQMIQLTTNISMGGGVEFTNSSKFMMALFCGQWGLPVLATDKKSGNPTFNSDALKLYQSHGDVTRYPERMAVVKDIMRYRELETYQSLFLDALLENRDDKGFVHPTYNQVVRTGRMSCSKPNAQQFNELSKKLIWTDEPRYGFYDTDASQIEFRVIVHYMGDSGPIQAYQQDPRTDFHTWVAEICEMKRKPAKNINFAHAFGAGEAKIIAMLSGDEDVIAAVNAELDAEDVGEMQRLKEFNKRTKARGMKVFETYHERLPELKKVAKRAQLAARKRGIVRNLFGRIRALPMNMSRIAFNTAVQGSANDIIKRRMIKTAPRYNPELRDADITQRVNVHDNILFHGPKDALREKKSVIDQLLEENNDELCVPIRWDGDLIEGETWR